MNDTKKIRNYLIEKLENGFEILSNEDVHDTDW